MVSSTLFCSPCLIIIQNIYPGNVLPEELEWKEVMLKMSYVLPSSSIRFDFKWTNDKEVSIEVKLKIDEYKSLVGRGKKIL